MIKKLYLQKPTELIQEFKKQRKRQKVTQVQLADFTRLHHKGIEKFEKPTSDPKLLTVFKIAEILGIKIILEFEDES